MGSDGVAKNIRDEIANIELALADARAEFHARHGRDVEVGFLIIP